jgi:hypothetical protein
VPFNEPEEQDIPLTQLSGTVVSHIANDWASYDQSPAAGPSLATPVYHQRQTKVSGYTAPASVYGPMGSSPQVYQPSADIPPKYIKVAMPSAESSGQQGLSRAVYPGPPLPSHDAMSPLSPPSDPAVMGFHNSPSYRHPEFHQPLERRYQEYSDRRHQALPSPPVQHRQVSSRLPTPQTSGFFGNQLTPPAYHMPPQAFPVLGTQVYQGSRPLRDFQREKDPERDTESLPLRLRMQEGSSAVSQAMEHSLTRIRLTVHRTIETSRSRAS